jgi:hypothetical protein
MTETEIAGLLKEAHQAMAAQASAAGQYTANCKPCAEHHPQGGGRCFIDCWCHRAPKALEERDYPAIAGLLRKAVQGSRVRASFAGHFIDTVCICCESKHSQSDGPCHANCWCHRAKQALAEIDRNGGSAISSGPTPAPAAPPAVQTQENQGGPTTAMPAPSQPFEFREPIDIRDKALEQLDRETGSTVKRGRGRPRKNPIPNTEPITRTEV